MKILNYIVGILFLTSLSVASAEIPERSSSTDKVEVEHVDAMKIEHPEEMGERPEIGEHPEMVEVEHDHGPGTSD